MNEFGKKVRLAREDQHFSQEALAIAAGLSRRTIQNVEAGQPASPETMRALMAVLNITDDPDALDHATMFDIPPPSSEEEWGRFYTKLNIGAVGMLTSVLLAFVLIPFELLGMSVPKEVLMATTIPFILSTMLVAITIQRGQSLRSETDVDLEYSLARERFIRTGSPH